MLTLQEASGNELVVTADDWSAWEQHTRSEFDPPQTLIIQDLVLDPEQSGRTLSLERVQPFANDSRLRINGEWVEQIISPRVYYRGSLIDEPSSIVALSIGEALDFRGLLASSEGYWMFISGEAPRSETSQLIALHQSDAPESPGFTEEHEHGFQCQVDGHIHDISASFLDARFGDAPPPRPD